MDLQLRYADKSKWSHTATFGETLDSLFLTQTIKGMWEKRIRQSAAVLRVNIVLHKLVSDADHTPSLFADKAGGSDALNRAMDSLTEKFGKKSLYLGGAHKAMETVKAKIAFQHIPDVKLED